jgi:SAM-dependent methyltransferase
MLIEYRILPVLPEAPAGDRAAAGLSFTGAVGCGANSRETMMSWQQAGVAWSARARDWAYLMEPLFAPVYVRLAAALQIGPDTDVLDMGCGAGLALRAYQDAGARTAGVDAAEGLLSIARERTSTADLRHASITELPWGDASFDVVTGVNSFVYADDGALAEAHRVLRPGGKLGIGYWRDPRDFEWPFRELGAALEAHVSADETHTPMRMADADATTKALASAGFTVVDRGEVDSVSEFPDAEIAYRGLASTGMMYPVSQAGEEDALRERSMAILHAAERPDSGVRMAAGFGWLAARRD